MAPLGHESVAGIPNGFGHEPECGGGVMREAQALGHLHGGGGLDKGPFAYKHDEGVGFAAHEPGGFKAGLGVGVLGRHEGQKAWPSLAVPVGPEAATQGAVAVEKDGGRFHAFWQAP